MPHLIPLLYWFGGRIAHPDAPDGSCGEEIRGTIDTYSFQTKPVPEPSTILLFGAGLVGLVGFRRKFMKN